MAMALRSIFLLILILQLAPLSAETSEQQSNANLQELLQLDQGHPSAALNMAIGDQYSALGQYGWAILYYRRAQAQTPRSQELELHLQQAHVALGIPYTTAVGWLPISERETILFALAVTAGLVLALSAMLWFPQHRFLRVLAAPLILLALGVGANLLYNQYAAPLQAIAVRSSLLQSSPDSTAIEAPGDALLEGSVVNVLDSVDQGRWLKIQLKDGREGYVAYPNVRII